MSYKTFLLVGALAQFALGAPALAGGPLPLEPETWLNVEDNSLEATKLLLEGEVGYELAVDAQGMATSCHVIRSSGHDLLDTHTCNLMRERARFVPATDQSGAAVPGVYRSSHVWHVITIENWVQDGWVTAQIAYDPGEEQVGDCAAKVDGLMSKYVKQMSCFILVNQARRISSLHGATSSGPLNVAMVLSVSPSTDSHDGSSILGDGWLRVALTDAVIAVSSNGMRADCRMKETRGDVSLIMPFCSQPSIFSYRLAERDERGLATGEISQRIAYFVQDSSGS